MPPALPGVRGCTTGACLSWRRLGGATPSGGHMSEPTWLRISCPPTRPDWCSGGRRRPPPPGRDPRAPAGLERRIFPTTKRGGPRHRSPEPRRGAVPTSSGRCSHTCTCRAKRTHVDTGCIHEERKTNMNNHTCTYACKDVNMTVYIRMHIRVNGNFPEQTCVSPAARSHESNSQATVNLSLRSSTPDESVPRSRPAAESKDARGSTPTSLLIV